MRPPAWQSTLENCATRHNGWPVRLNVSRRSRLRTILWPAIPIHEGDFRILTTMTIATVESAPHSQPIASTGVLLEVIDALRGFAILGIFLINIPLMNHPVLRMSSF